MLSGFAKYVLIRRTPAFIVFFMSFADFRVFLISLLNFSTQFATTKHVMFKRKGCVELLFPHFLV